jgi:hypothetical protein
MASTLTLQADAPGKGAKRPVKSLGSRQIGLAVYKIAFGNPYVVGGENIAAIWDDFAEVIAIVPSQVDATAADRREWMVDLTAKTIRQYDAFNTEETATDQSAVADVRLLVIGYVK